MYCKEIENLLIIIELNQIIYISNKGFEYCFIAYKKEKLFFSIPNHLNPSKPYIKSISKLIFCKLINKLLDEKKIESTDFPFQDCRKAAFYGYLNILYPSAYVKNGGIYKINID